MGFDGLRVKWRVMAMRYGLEPNAFAWVRIAEVLEWTLHIAKSLRVGSLSAARPHKAEFLRGGVETLNRES